jgi:hypothetical protein
MNESKILVTGATGKTGKDLKKLLITILAMVSFASVSYAAGNHSTSIRLYEKVYVGSHMLNPGDYSVKWVDGSNELFVAGNRANFSVPITVAPGPAGPTALTIASEGDKSVLRGLKVQATSITIVDSDSKQSSNTNSAQ